MIGVSEMTCGPASTIRIGCARVIDKGNMLHNLYGKHSHEGRRMNELEQKAYIFATIFTLSNKLQMLGDRFDENITTKQWLFIVGVSVFEKPPMVGELANFVGYSRQNAKRIAAVLQRRGYVNLSDDEHDARALRIELTPKCKQYFQRREQREIDFLERIFAGFDAGSTRGLYTGLTMLKQNIIEIMKSDKGTISEEDLV